MSIITLHNMSNLLYTTFTDGEGWQETMLLFSTSENTIDRYKLRTESRENLIPNGRIFDYDNQRNKLYWKNLGNDTLYSNTLLASRRGVQSSAEVVLRNPGVRFVSDIAVDWVNNNLYVGYYNGTIEVYSASTRRRKVLHRTRTGLQRLRVDPRDHMG